MANQRTPKYLFIADDLEQAIMTGKYRDGDLLPSEAQLTTQYKVSRITVRKALETLKKKSLIASEQGVGSIVNRRYVHNLSEVKDLHTSFVPQGIENRILEFQVQQPDASIRKLLALGEDDLVYYVVRQRYFQGRLIILEICYLPVTMFPDLSYQALQNSIFAYVESVNQYQISNSDDEILPEIVSGHLADMLGVPAGTAVLKIVSSNYLTDGRPFQYSIAYHRSDNYRLKIHIDQSHK